MKRRGITLVEMLITLVILGMIVVVVASLFIGSGQFASDERARIDVGISASRTLGPLDEILREGKEVLASAIVNSTTYTSDHDTLVFSLPSINSGGATDAANSDTAVITVDTTNPDNTVLRLLIDPASGTYRPANQQVILENIKDVYFRYSNDTPASAQSVNVTVQISKNLRNRVYTRSTILYAVFRNHP